MSINYAGVNMAGLDERQVAARTRGGTWSWLVLLVLVFANGWINDHFGRWGSGVVQAVTLFFVSALVFTCHAIWSSAHWASRDGGRRMLGLFALVVLMDAALFVWKAVGGDEGLSVWHHRTAGKDFPLLVETVFFVIVALASAMRLRRDHHDELAEDVA